MYGLFQFADHLVSVGDEVRAGVATVELHAFNDIEFSSSAFGFFDGDNAFVANRLHRVSDHVANFAAHRLRRSCRPERSRLVFDLLGALLAGLQQRFHSMSMPRFRSIGFMPAATDLAPSRTMLEPER